MRQLVFDIGLAVAALALAFSCENGYDPVEPETYGAAAHIHDYSCERVVLAYLGGDNNLSAEVDQKINALAKGWDPEIKGKLVIYADPSNTTPRLLEIGCDASGQTRTTTVREYPETNSADPVVFASVLNDVKMIYPSDHYGLIVFSHGTGWTPGPDSPGTRSIIVDKGREMEISDFASGIPNSLFDFIIFEACFMSGIEVAYELRNKTEYILASSAEILSPGFREVYQTTLCCLFANKPRLDMFAAEAYAFFNSRNGDYRSATLSVIETAPLVMLADWLTSNIEKLTDVDVSGLQRFDRTRNNIYYDFEQYFQLQVGSASRQQELSRLTGTCVKHKYSTDQFMPSYNGFSIDRHSGLTTYIMRESQVEMNEGYRKLAWYDDVISKII